MYLAIGKFKLDNLAVAYTDTRHYGINEIFQYGSLCLSGELFKINASFLQCSIHEKLGSFLYKYLLGQIGGKNGALF